MYSMAAFGPVLGFLLGAYLLSFHMDAFSGDFVGNNGELNFLLINCLFPTYAPRINSQIRLIEDLLACGGLASFCAACY